MEGEWRGAKTFVRGTYTFMRYYGNFDQDNTTGAVNDMNTFIGSSNIADGAGRQLWDFKYGNLRGDRPHLLKIYGARQLPWNASTGFFFIFQSGQPWEIESFEPYRSPDDQHERLQPVRGAGGLAANRLPLAGRPQLHPEHHHLARYTAQLVLDVFNVFDRQTGYNIEPQATTRPSGQPRSYYNPRRLQLAARFLF